MFNTFIRLLFVYVCLACPSLIFSWSGTGHMLVAQIAAPLLKPETKKQIDELITLYKDNFPESDTFITATCWADDLNAFSLYAFDDWHSILIPYDPQHLLNETERQLIMARMERSNLEWAINQCIDTLTSPKAGPFEKAFMLRLLLHFVADAHHPLHCIALYNKQFPHGDKGGLLFHVTGVYGTNLHKFWDYGLDSLKDLHRPLNENGKKYLVDLARELTTAYPSDPKLLGEENSASWINESHQIAIEVVYNGVHDGGKPSDTYIAKGRQVARQRITIAGYRLARLLNTIFK